MLESSADYIREISRGLITLHEAGHTHLLGQICERIEHFVHLRGSYQPDSDEAALLDSYRSLYKVACDENLTIGGRYLEGLEVEVNHCEHYTPTEESLRMANIFVRFLNREYEFENVKSSLPSPLLLVSEVMYFQGEDSNDEFWESNYFMSSDTRILFNSWLSFYGVSNLFTKSEVSELSPRIQMIVDKFLKHMAHFIEENEEEELALPLFFSIEDEINNLLQFLKKSFKQSMNMSLIEKVQLFAYTASLDEEMKSDFRGSSDIDLFDGYPSCSSN